MPERSIAFPAFLRRAPVLAVSLVLALQIGIFYGGPTAEHIPNPPPLKDFPAEVLGWRTVQEMPLDPETQAFLKADDTLNRVYTGPSGGASLFVAFFRSQRAGTTPHSPKVCLPGAGWSQESSRIVSMAVPGEPKNIDVNRYIVSRGENRSLVYYWYATQHYVVAGEYAAKALLMLEGIRYRRSDESLVRVITPIAGQNEAGADAVATGFIRSVYDPLKRHMWSN